MRFLAVLVAVLVFIALPVRAAVDSPLVRAGVAAYEALEYERAVDLLMRAQKEQLTVEELAVALRTIGFAEVARGRTDAARQAFQALLAVDPSHALDRSVSPRVRTVFEEARAEARPKAQPKLQREPTPSPASSRAVAPATPPPPVGAVVTTAPPPPAAVVTTAPPPQKKPVYKRAWFWGVLGGTAAAALAAGLLGGLLGTRIDGGTLVIVPR